MIQCSCIKGLYDCRVNTITSDKIIYHDLSTWMEDSYYILPDDYKITVTTPGGSEHEISVFPKASTVLSSEDLGIKWYDGIYCFKAESCGEVYTKNVALLYKAKCCLDNLLSRAEIMDNFDKHFHWSSMVKGIEHLTEMGRIDSAHKLYKALRIELDQFENCC